MNENNLLIQYHCPEFYFGKTLYEALIDLEINHPEYFYENVKIKSIFGGFPNMIWNGGGIDFNNFASINQIKYIKSFYEDLGIPIKLNLTNILVTEKDCYDRYCNKVVEIMENGNNQILVASPILENYLRKNFQGYKYCKSIIATEKDFDYEEELKNYYEIVLPRRKLKDFNFLNSIKQENRSKFEILCNDPCPINCPRLYSHYKDFAKVTLFECCSEDIQLCTAINPTELRGESTIKDQILVENIINDYLPIGYNQFKIAGRGSFYNALHGVIKYFIKKEYQYEAIFYMLAVCEHE